MNRKRDKLVVAIATICVLLSVLFVITFRYRDGTNRSSQVAAVESDARGADALAEVSDRESRRPGRTGRQREPRSFGTFLKGILPKTDFETVNDGYFKAWLLARDGEKRWEGGEDDAAYASLLACRDAYAYFLGVRETDPDWRTEMVERRLAIVRRQLQEYYEAYHHGTVSVSPDVSSKGG